MESLEAWIKLALPVPLKLTHGLRNEVHTSNLVSNIISIFIWQRLYKFMANFLELCNQLLYPL